MKIYKISQKVFLPKLTGEQMIDFITENKLENWCGKLDYNDAKEIGRLVDEWRLTRLPLSLFDWVTDSTNFNRSLGIPPIVLFINDRYEVLDGKHRIGMAKDRGDQQIEVYLGELNE